jgi:hypothetical protein
VYWVTAVVDVLEVDDVVVLSGTVEVVVRSSWRRRSSSACQRASRFDHPCPSPSSLSDGSSAHSAMARSCSSLSSAASSALRLFQSARRAACLAVSLAEVVFFLAATLDVASDLVLRLAVAAATWGRFWLTIPVQYDVRPRAPAHDKLMWMWSMWALCPEYGRQPSAAP